MRTRYFALILLGLLATYIFIPHVYLWDPINETIFKILNSSLYLGKPIQIMWASLNNHYNDWVIDVVFLTCFISYIRADNNKSRGQKVMELISCILVMVFTIFVVNKIIFRNFFPVRIDSPSVNFSGYLNINHLVPYIRSKVYAYGCFPGDHATTALLFCFLTRPLFSQKTRKYLLVYIIMLILPRIVIGAHNFSDVLLGSMPIAFFVSRLCHKNARFERFSKISFLKLQPLLFKKKTTPL